VFALITFKVPGLDFIDSLGQGAAAAAKAINASGGIGGRPVVIESCDSMLTPAGATDCAHSTLTKHPMAEFGCEPSWSAAGLQIYAAAGVPSFNCTNTYQDYHNTWSFGMATGAVGEQAATAKYLCTMPSVKTVAFMGEVDPALQAAVPPLVTSILKSCGKKPTNFTWVPIGAADFAPFVARIVATEPDFVVTDVSGAELVPIMKAFEQNGYPPSQVSMNSTQLDLKQVLTPAGASMNGMYATSEWTTWGDTSDPDITAYTNAAKAVGANYTDPNVQQGYLYVESLYTAAKQIGFDKFTSASLASFMRSATGVHIPMSRTLINPGPTAYPQLKQPYVQILRWMNGKIVVVQNGTNDGWINAF
jgi:ABC-type branched-subunit amino acid transport system substrate-binding protein